MSQDARRTPSPGRSLRTVGCTGSPLLDTTHRWMAAAFGPNVHIAAVSGGTDVCSGFVGPNPLLPVRVGEMQCRMLGVACAAYDEHGRPVIDTIGELVITEPMPSMPLFFWGDPGGQRMQDTYFAAYPGVWRHGDWIRFTDRGTAVIYGRSDSTLNRGGVRMGTSEFYSVLALLPEISDALVVDTAGVGTRGSGELLLFVVLADAALDDELDRRIRTTIRAQLSPRHVPDRILAVDGIPYTLTGKKCEIPVKRILQGIDETRAIDLQSLRNPEVLGPLLDAAR